MQLDAIITTILSAAAFLKKPVQDAAGESVKDILDAARYYLKKKFGEGSDGAEVLDLALEKPDSAMRKGMLLEEAQAEGLASDSELPRLAKKLAALLPAGPEPIGQNVRVDGRDNQVLVAGRDVIHTERVVHRSAVVPDGRHLTAEQRNQIRAVIADLAARLAGVDGRPNFAAGHRMLRHNFHVLSYALIPRERFEEALRFLKKQCAIHRSRLRERDPVVYRAEVFRAVLGRARELGWDGARMCKFAEEKLGLKKPLVTLNELGSDQLKSLADFMRGHARPARSANGSKRDPIEARQENS